MNNKFNKKILILFFLLLVAVVLGIAKGAVRIPLVELFSKANQPIIYLRILRVITAIIAGSGLAVSGVALQAILRNPLAEPYLLGSSSGAALGAVLAIIVGLSSLYLPFIAFLAALITISLVYKLSQEGNRLALTSLLLNGVILSIALSAITVFLVSSGNNEKLHSLMFWLWGSCQVYDFNLIFITAILVGLGLMALFSLSQDLNAISLGEEEAIHLGVDIEKLKRQVFFITAIITASIVSLCGVIGFVGLIIPHMLRLIIGPNHKRLILASCIAGSSFMVICDLLSRSLISHSEIPIGIMTAIIGTPIFIILLKRKSRIK